MVLKRMRFKFDDIKLGKTSYSKIEYEFFIEI